MITIKDTYVFIEGGRIICPASGLDRVGTLVIREGRIEGVTDRPGSGGRTLEASGCVVAPGFIDLHCDLASPGHPHREGLETGTAAAAQGGFTTLCLSPATEPVLDQPEAAVALVRANTRVHLAPIAALTQGLLGQRLCELHRLRAAGAVAAGDGGHAMRDTGLLRRALEYARAAGLPVCLFPEDRDLKGKGVMHEGPVATRLGLPGIPALAEVLATTRACLLAELTGAHIHLGPVTTAGALAVIADARSRGVPISASTTTAHLHLTDADIAVAYDPHLRVRPPLRPATDVAALRAAVAAGTVQAVGSGHEPRSPAEKSEAFTDAAPGMAGLEAALGLMLLLVEAGELDLPAAIARLTAGPAAALGLTAGRLAPGDVADVVVFDPIAWHRVDGGQSRARNTPFLGRALPGRVLATFVDGRTVFTSELGTC